MLPGNSLEMLSIQSESGTGSPTWRMNASFSCLVDLSPFFMKLSHMCFRNKTCCPPQPAFCLVLQYGKPNWELGRGISGSALKKSLGSLLASCASEPTAVDVIVLWPYVFQVSDGVLGKKLMRNMNNLWFAQNSVHQMRMKRGIANSTVFKDFFFVCALFEKPSFPISSSSCLSPPPQGSYWSSSPQCCCPYKENDNLYLSGLLWRPDEIIYSRLSTWHIVGAQ